MPVKKKVSAYEGYSEAEWQSIVLSHVRAARGYKVYFIPDGMWRRAFVNGTPQSLGDRGFPDLVIAGRGRLMFRELKREDGKLSKFQEEWRDFLIDAGCDWKLWKPSMVDEVIQDLYGDNNDQG